MNTECECCENNRCDCSVKACHCCCGQESCKCDASCVCNSCTTLDGTIFEWEVQFALATVCGLILILKRFRENPRYTLLRINFHTHKIYNIYIYILQTKLVCMVFRCIKTSICCCIITFFKFILCKFFCQSHVVN